MEQTRTFNGQRISVAVLMRNGEDLAEALRGVLNSGTHTRDVITPYIQLVSSDTTCEHTGYRLSDIWRYFRHTWANPYKSVPGRSLGLLIRDAAAQYHPVIGIAALSSSAVQIGPRDEWIGWNPESVVRHLRCNGNQDDVDWLLKLVRSGMDALYVDDLFAVRGGKLTPESFRSPTQETLSWLLDYAEEKREEHHNKPDRKAYKQPARSGGGSRVAHWWSQAETNLFKSKRAETLALLLRAQMVLCPEGRVIAPDRLMEALNNPEKRQAIQSLVRKAKSERIGICLADISVCGAIPPYSHLLGGKLVAMLATSPELIVAYRDRYKNTESIIASSLAGRPIVRAPELVYLGTTSLYGTEPTQYTRVSVPGERIGGNPGTNVTFHCLGKTGGYGTLQFSRETFDALETMVRHAPEGQVRVNNIFGEGSSPRLRSIRDGLDMLTPEHIKDASQNSDLLLSHGSARVLYGVPLIRNLRNYLLGMEEQPDYIASLTNIEQSTRAIGDWWAERWLKSRLQKPGILEAVAMHNGQKHGARVKLSAQLGLANSA